MIGQGLAFLGLALLFALAGFLLRCGIGANLIPGYRSLKPEEREKRDETAMCRYAGLVLYGFSASWIVAAFGAFFMLLWLALTGIGLFLLVAVLGLLFASRQKAFRK